MKQHLAIAFQRAAPEELQACWQRTFGEMPALAGSSQDLALILAHHVCETWFQRGYGYFPLDPWPALQAVQKRDV
ncbi:hypothetical protein GCM10007036_31400 [Alsobacter metallidurans]|uniref:Uncharacterized protein n=1 Tax=Alsobacter metallidurans TaxID=340221 RepID=A0A917MIJ0_9HYPH|nr:hypothetical protein [Alsobacter metallidurans]GGH24762.1 hypothetical protein GCM10007036_31400 [Alsobacter metallidurans]